MARAEEAYRRALALDPDFADLRLRLGSLSLRRGGAAEAEAEATQGCGFSQTATRYSSCNRPHERRVSEPRVESVHPPSRAVVAGSLCLLTAAYATLNCSTFAFDMFIRPQLFPWITSFVNWHHICVLLPPSR